MVRSSIEDLVKHRYSCRSYLDQPIEAASRQDLTEFLDALRTGPFGNTTRFSLVAATENDREALKRLGTYGFIKGAPGFIVGAVEPGLRNLEDYGHCLERAVLEATDLGLQTCWLGGSFSKSSFARRIKSARNETVPAVVAVGYPAEGSKDTRMRQMAGSNRRLPPEQLFFEGRPGQPLDLSLATEYADALEAVRWAPSASNKQPWRLVRSGKTSHFYLQRTKGYGKGTATFSLLRLADLQRVDMGIAMSHFDLVNSEHGLSGRWVVDEPPLEEAVASLEYAASWISEGS